MHNVGMNSASCLGCLGLVLLGCSTDTFLGPEDAGPGDQGLTGDAAFEGSADVLTGEASTSEAGDGGEGDGGEADSTTPATYKVGDYVPYVSSTSFNVGFMVGETVVLVKPATLVKFGAICLTSGVHVTMALYSDSGGAPGTLLAYSGSALTTGSDQEVSPNANVALGTGVYWIMATYDANVSLQVDSSTTNQRDYISFVYGDTLPTTFPTPMIHYGIDFNYYLVVE
jgi:hypothetical protein